MSTYFKAAIVDLEYVFGATFLKVLTCFQNLSVNLSRDKLNIFRNLT